MRLELASFCYSINYPCGLDRGICFLTVEDTEFLLTIAKVTVIPDEGGDTPLACLLDEGLAVIGHVFVDAVCLRTFEVIGNAPFL